MGAKSSRISLPAVKISRSRPLAMIIARQDSLFSHWSMATLRSVQNFVFILLTGAEESKSKREEEIGVEENEGTIEMQDEEGRDMRMKVFNRRIIRERERERKRTMIE